MTRMKSERGVVHYRCPANTRLTLCGEPAGQRISDLFGGEYREWPLTTERVTCPDCAKVICACRNEPYNTLNAEVEDATMMRGIYAAVQPDGPVPPAEAQP